MKIILFQIVCCMVILTSCSGYTKVLKSDDYDKKFELANDLFDRGKWAQSITLYEQVYQRLPKTGQGEVSYFRIGKAYFEDGDYYSAAYYFGSFFDKYPHSTKVEEAFFLKAISAVKNSPNYTLDQGETEMALNDVQQFIYLFPNSNRLDTCNKLMDNLRFKLEKKDFESIKLYSKTMNYRSAVVAAETFLNTYPATKFREEVLYISIKNSFLLAKNSVDTKKKERIDKTIESYRTFVAQFPESQYSKELKDLHDEMQKELKNITNSK